MKKTPTGTERDLERVQADGFSKQKSPSISAGAFSFYN